MKTNEQISQNNERKISNGVTKENIYKLIAAIAISEFAGVLGTFFTMPSISTWYTSIIKSPLNPPAWIFAPVWTILFVLMGISYFLVWKKGLQHKKIKVALSVFIGQLILNVLWSIIFFGNHNPGLAFAEIIILWISILITIIFFWKISKASAWILLPYILWVTFAGFLNYSVWQLNKNVDSNISENSNVTTNVVSTVLWKTTYDEKQKISYKYPGNLFLKFTDIKEWPPIVSIQKGTFSCETTAETSSLSVRTSKKTMNDSVYCIKASSEGAAGSVYTDFIYNTEKDGEIVTVKFTIQYPHCENYDEPDQTSCQDERKAFDIDATISGIVQSIIFN